MFIEDVCCFFAYFMFSALLIESLHFRLRVEEGAGVQCVAVDNVDFDPDYRAICL